MMNSAPASLSSVTSGTRQRSKSIHKKDAPPPPSPSSLEHKVSPVMTTMMPHQRKQVPSSSSSSVQRQHRRHKTRRRTRSEDNDNDDEAFLAGGDITATSLRRVGLLLLAGCLLFAWDLFHLMGYIERLDEGNNKNKDDGPVSIMFPKGTSSLRGKPAASVPSGAAVPSNQTEAKGQTR